MEWNNIIYLFELFPNSVYLFLQFIKIENSYYLCNKILASVGNKVYIMYDDEWGKSTEIASRIIWLSYIYLELNIKYEYSLTFSSWWQDGWWSWTELRFW